MSLFLFFAFVMLGLVSLVPSQQIGWEELLRHDLLRIGRDMKTLI